MFYREAGDFKASYREDNQTFPIAFDRMRYYFVLIVAFLVLPFMMNDWWANSIFLPFLIYAIAAIGLNILVGYAGQVSLGTGGFMAVGAYACYKLMTAFPDVSILIHLILAGGITAAVGAAVGLPSLRIKGFYLAVATLAAQFFFVWLFNKVGWFYNYSASGMIAAPTREVFFPLAGLLNMGQIISERVACWNPDGGFCLNPEFQPFERYMWFEPVTGATARASVTYTFCLIFVTVSALAARNLTRGTLGRTWMSIRDMDIAAEIIGVNPLKAKLTAFAVSSFFVGIAGALFFAVYLGSVEVGEAFGLDKSFNVLFMVIIGGLGSIFGSFAGAAFLVLLPVALKILGVDMLGFPPDLVAHFQHVIVGALIVIFLIMEPHGLAQLWRVTKEKLRLWPFPH